MVKREPVVQYEFYPVSKIEENPWNPNQMPADKYGALREDMKLGGPTVIDPILTASKRAIFKDPSIPEDIRITIDGNHRLRLARELGWHKIREEFNPAVDSEEKARVISYAKNVERGEVDPYRQAEYFRWFVDHGWTHEKIAKKHRIDRTTVTKYLSLIKINPQTREKLANMPRVTISHLEPIATLDHGQQGKFAKDIVRDHKRDPPTVESIEREVRHIKEEARRAEALRRAVEKAKFKKCPMCGKPPNRESYRGFPWVRCDNFHEWSLDEGIPKERRSAASGEHKTPQSIKSEKPLDDFVQTFRRIVSELLSTLGEIESITLWGKNKAGKKISVSGGFWGDWSTNIDVEVQGGPKFKLNVHKTKIKDSPNIRTRISGPHIESKHDLAKFERQISEVFEKFEVDKQIKTGKAGVASKQKVGRLQNYIIPVTVDGTTFNLWLSANQLRKIRKAELKARIHIDVEIPEGERKEVRR